MKWIKLTLQTMAEAVDLVSDMLNELGIEGIEVIDNVPITEQEKKAMFIDILPDLDLEDKTAILNFYLEVDKNPEEMIEQIKVGLEELSQFTDVGSGNITISETEDVDWINNWKAFFKPFRIDDTIVIKPTWEELQDPNEDDIIIEIDPGTAFGTGSHETTKLCILGIKKYMNSKMHILDVGSGSGILSIIAAKLGASFVLGTEIDPIAVDVAYENFAVNHIEDGRIKVICGNIIEDNKIKEQVGYECYDLVVANILADVIIPLSGEIARHLKTGGYFISSGIIHTKKDVVKEAILKNGFHIVEILEMGDWVSIVAQK